MQNSPAALLAVAVALLAGAAPASARPPHGEFSELPLPEIKPRGWLKTWLQNQAAGLTGHPEEHGFPFDRKLWDEADPAKQHSDWSRYEQTGYWVDGAIRCAALIDDAALRRKAEAIIRSVLDHADADGYLGPRCLKKLPRPDDANAGNAERVFDGQFLTGTGKHPSDAGFTQWPHAVFFRSLQALYYATGDKSILDALTRHYLESGVEWYCLHRSTVNAETVLWLYGQTGDTRLLDLARRLLDSFHALSPSDLTAEQLLTSGMTRSHAVSFAELTKLGAIFYLHTGDRRLLDASANAVRKVQRDHVLISGVYSSQEGLAEKGSLAAIETCNVSDYTWSLGYLLMATGEAPYADAIERAIFNAGAGCVRADFRGLQYFSVANQVICDHQSNHAPTNTGNARMSYRPHHEVECCAGNVHRFMPNYAARMWMATRDGLVAALYGPSRIEHAGLTIEEQTAYPFDETITFRVAAADGREQSLRLRIPGWCDGATLEVNGQRWDGPLRPGTFVDVRRRFAADDSLVLRLPMTVRAVACSEGGIAIERGPLVYALKAEERWERDTSDATQSDRFPAWNLYAASDWNYALDVDESSVASAVKVERRQSGIEPWTPEGSPVVLRVPARRVNRWDLRTLENVKARFRGQAVVLPGPLKWNPPLPEPAQVRSNLSETVEEVVLVPYGCARARIALFPRARLPARDWIDEFDGRSAVGWDIRGGLLAEIDGCGVFRSRDASSRRAVSSEMLADFSRPIMLRLQAPAAAGPWSVAVVDEKDARRVIVSADGPGTHALNLSQALRWTGPRRFRLEIRTPAGPGEQLRLDHVRVTAD